MEVRRRSGGGGRVASPPEAGAPAAAGCKSPQVRRGHWGNGALGAPVVAGCFGEPASGGVADMTVFLTGPQVRVGHQAVADPGAVRWVVGRRFGG
ncbi:hypothetical protein GCM10029964_118310 [Kibdelosporangium lantanae]